MPKLNVGQVMEREAKAQARKDEWRTVYEDCYEFALPQRNLYSGYYEGGVSGKNKMTRVFDSTAIHATQRFATAFKLAYSRPIKSGAAWKLAVESQNKAVDKRNLCLINTQPPCLKHYARQTLTWQWASSC
jgi:hypothetical protein